MDKIECTIKNVLSKELEKYTKEIKEEQKNLQRIKDSLNKEELELQFQRIEIKFQDELLKNEKKKFEEKEKTYKNTAKRQLDVQVTRLTEENKRLKVELESNSSLLREFYQKTCDQLLDIINDRMDMNPTIIEREMCKNFGVEKTSYLTAVQLYFEKNKNLNLLSKEELEKVDMKYINLPPHNKSIDISEEKEKPLK